MQDPNKPWLPKIQEQFRSHTFQIRVKNQYSTQRKSETPHPTKMYCKRIADKK